MSFNILSPFVASPGTRSTYLTDLCKDIPLFFFFFFFHDMKAISLKEDTMRENSYARAKCRTANIDLDFSSGNEK